MLLHLLHHMHFCSKTSQGDRYPGCPLLVVLCLGDIADLDRPEMLRKMWFQAVQHTSCSTRRCPRWQRVRPCPGNNCTGRLREDRWQPRDLQGLVEHLGGRGVELRPRGAGARVRPRAWTWAGRRAELSRRRQMSSASIVWIAFAIKKKLPQMLSEVTSAMMTLQESEVRAPKKQPTLMDPCIFSTLSLISWHACVQCDLLKWNKGMKEESLAFSANRSPTELTK